MDYVSLIVGVVIGGIIGFLIKPKNADDNKTELAQLRALHQQQKMEIERLRADNIKLVGDTAASRQEAETLKNIREKMLNDFKAISNDLIEKQKDSVVDTQKTVLTPVTAQMEKIKENFDNQIKDMLKNSSESRASIDAQIKGMMSQSGALQREAENLANALKNKKQQGCWGEMQLETIFEMLDFREGREYHKEFFTKSEEGNGRPDYVLNLPDGRKVIIDSKVSLTSYMNYVNAEDENEKQKYLSEFIAATENHIKTLGSRDYQKKLKETQLDYVFMFMPLESSYFAALSGKKDLYNIAYENNVAIITPSLLLPMMRTIDTLLKMDKQNKNIAKAVVHLEGIYTQFCNFTRTYSNIDTKIESAQQSLKNVKEEYDNSVKQLTTGRGNLAKRFDDMKKESGIQPTKNIAIEFDGNDATEDKGEGND